MTPHDWLAAISGSVVLVIVVLFLVRALERT